MTISSILKADKAVFKYVVHKFTKLLLFYGKVDLVLVWTRLAFSTLHCNS